MLTLCLALSVLAADAADEAPQTFAGLHDAAAVTLFNGEDLAGWSYDDRFWTVGRDDDGPYIQGQTTPDSKAPGNTFLIYTGGDDEPDVFDDFELTLKYRILTGNNSGVQYRSHVVKPYVVSGYQAEVENKLGKTGFLYHEKGRGWLVNVGDFVVIDEDGNKTTAGKVADVDALKAAPYHHDKAWNEYRIVARGNHVLHYLNGHPTVELIDHHIDPRNPDSLKQRRMDGVIALQIHGGSPMTVQFKDVAVRPYEASFGETTQVEPRALSDVDHRPVIVRYQHKESGHKESGDVALPTAGELLLQAPRPGGWAEYEFRAGGDVADLSSLLIPGEHRNIVVIPIVEPAEEPAP